MLDAGHRLDAADGLLARRPAHAHQGQQSDSKRQREQGENDLVRQLGQPGPQSGQGSADEQASQPENQPRARPKLLEQQRPFAQAHFALEDPLDGRGRRLRA